MVQLFNGLMLHVQSNKTSYYCGVNMYEGKNLPIVLVQLSVTIKTWYNCFMDSCFMCKITKQVIYVAFRSWKKKIKLVECYEVRWFKGEVHFRLACTKFET